MSRRQELDPETADRLLAGHGGGPPHLSAALARIAGPARPGELAGEEAAVAVFRQARAATALSTALSTALATALPPAQAPAYRLRTATRWARWVTVKTGAVALALAAGGVALAASTGVLPNPLTGGVSPTHTPRPTTLVSASQGPAGAKDPSATTAAAPPAAMRGLCTAYLAQVATAPGKATESPAFGELAAAAGGADNIATYCQTVLNRQTESPPPGHAQSDDHQTGPPSAHPTSHDPKGKASTSPR